MTDLPTKKFQNIENLPANELTADDFFLSYNSESGEARTVKESALATKRVTPLPDITSLSSLNTAALVDGQQFYMTGWRTGSDLGGGDLYYDSTRPQTDHDGGTVFALGATPPTDFNDPAQIEAYLNAGSGLTGNGCLVRLGVPTVYSFGAIEGDSASNAKSINAAILAGARGVDAELVVYEPIELPSSRVYFDGMRIKPSASFSGSYIIDATAGLNFEGLSVSADGKDLGILDRDDMATLSYGYFRDFTASDTPESTTGGVVFRGVDNIDGAGLSLQDLKNRDAVRVRNCDDGQIIGVVSIGCGARTCAISDSSNNFFVRNIEIKTDYQNSGSFASGEHLYASGELPPAITNCGYSDVSIDAPDVVRNLAKFSRDSNGCSLVGAHGTIKSSTGFNGALSAQGSPNTLFRDIHLVSTQNDTSGTGSLLFCRPHPTTGTQSSGTKFIDVYIEGFTPGVQLDASDTGGAAGEISDILFKDVYVTTEKVGFIFAGGSYSNIQVKDCEFFSSNDRAINTDFGAMVAVEGIVFENVTAKTEIATQAARFPSQPGGTQIIRCNFKRVHTAGEDVVWAQTDNGIVAHNVFKGGTVLYDGIGTLADNFNLIIDS